MNKIISLYFLLVGISYASGLKEIELSKSIIKSDYIEGKKLENTKQIYIIDNSKIEKEGYKNISEVLNDVPGVSVGTSGWGEIDIRGQGADQANKNIQVMVDGAPITTLVNHPFQTNYDVVPVEQIERIEVIPGGGSVLYGNGASGGVINISTNLKNMAKSKNNLGYEYMQNNKKKYYFNLGNSLSDKLYFQLNYSKKDENLYFVDTYKKNDYFSGGLTYNLNENQNISLRYSHFNEKAQFIKNISKKNLETYGKNYKPSYKKITIGIDKDGKKVQTYKRGYLNGDRKIDSLKGNYTYSFNKKSKFIIDIFGDKGYFTNNNDLNKKMYQKTHGIKSKVDLSYWNNNSILFGVDYYTQNANLKYVDYVRDKNSKILKYKERPLNFDYERNVIAIYVLNKNTYKDFEFSQGIRNDITVWNFEKNASDGQGKDERKTINRAYELSTGWNYNDTGKIYVRYERGFTGPDGLQISDRVYENGEKIYKKTNAEDEIFDIYEVGIRDYILGSSVNITAFYTNTNNQLNRLYTRNKQGKLEYKTLNLLKTERYGIETSLYQEIGKFSFEENYTWLRGKTGYNSDGEKFIEEGNKVDWTKSGLKKVPEHTVKLKMAYNFTSQFNGKIAYNYIGGYNNYFKKADRSEDSLVKSHSIVNLSLNYNMKSGVEIYGGINNIFNEHYYSYVSDSFATVIPSDERTLFMGIKYTF